MQSCQHATNKSCSLEPAINSSQSASENKELLMQNFDDRKEYVSTCICAGMKMGEVKPFLTRDVFTKSHKNQNIKENKI
jgi:hypothetical protein